MPKAWKTKFNPNNYYMTYKRCSHCKVARHIDDYKKPDGRVLKTCVRCRGYREKERLKKSVVE